MKFLLAITTKVSIMAFPPNKQQRIELEIDKAISNGLDGVILYTQQNKRLYKLLRDIAIEILNISASGWAL